MVLIRNAPDRWGAIAQVLHWSMAVLIFAQFGLGWIAVAWRLSPTKIELFVWHKSLGVVLLLLALLRLAWWVGNPTPARPATMGIVERRLANISHALLYFVMIAMPLSGWAISSTANIPFRVFGVFPWPNLLGPDPALQKLAEITHLGLFGVFLAAVALHIGAALRHHIVMKDEVLSRMLPCVRRAARRRTGSGN